ncbi:MAG: uncharacterized protein KVP18_003593 [Porospora cf. gigantea A]|uniref:uncharacterized protein n=1 Tax=Porospora cf. gigantea A TaxID=2853593 RepID=UPI003559DDF3|nr:MAG: hypothetical protein KVP18_003593 [Porospora cf. gigantea A]
MLKPIVQGVAYCAVRMNSYVGLLLLALQSLMRPGHKLLHASVVGLILRDLIPAYGASRWTDARLLEELGSLPVVISLTSTSQRVIHTKSTLSSLCSQNVPFKYEVILVEEPSQPFPPELELDCAKIVRIPVDVGPASKIVGALHYEIPEDTIILYVDDDRLWHNNLLRSAVQASLMNPDSVTAGEPSTLLPSGRTLLFPLGFDIPVAEFGVVVRRKFLTGLEPYLRRVFLRESACWRADDLTLAAFYHSKAIPIQAAPWTLRESWPSDAAKQELPLGKLSDALHLQPGGNEHAYSQCAPVLPVNLLWWGVTNAMGSLVCGALLLVSVKDALH